MPIISAPKRMLDIIMGTVPMAPTSHSPAASASTCGAPEGKRLNFSWMGRSLTPCSITSQVGMPCIVGWPLTRTMGLSAARAGNAARAQRQKPRIAIFTVIRFMAVIPP